MFKIEITEVKKIDLGMPDELRMVYNRPMPLPEDREMVVGDTSYTIMSWEVSHGSSTCSNLTVWEQSSPITTVISLQKVGVADEG